MSAPQQLVHLPVSQILAFWRPGSRGDEWTWRDEYAEAIAKPETAALAVREQLLAVLKLAPEPHPITLGPDGRVWDGHHRICIAIFLGTEVLPVRIIKEEEDK